MSSSSSSSPPPPEDSESNGVVHRSRSTSPSSSGFIRVVKSQLNFFMTRLLFMEGDNAEDSLQAQLKHKQHPKEEERYIEVIPDNAKILPNAVAKSMPPIPPPPSAPPSPRSIEGKAGLLQIRLLQAQNGSGDRKKVVEPTPDSTSTSTTVSDNEDEGEPQQPPLATKKKTANMIRENSVKHFPQNRRRQSGKAVSARNVVSQKLAPAGSGAEIKGVSEHKGESS